MFYSTLTTAATLLALAPAALAIGSAHVINNCGMPVYFASVAQSGADNMAQLPNSGYSEQYSLPNVGVSIKIAPNMTGKVTQFEFTWAAGNINYDISNIDGNPFSAQGMSLVPSMAGTAGFPSCQAVNCPAGQSTCSAAYNAPNDIRTMVCPEDSDLVMTLCPGGSSHQQRDVTPAHQHGHRIHSRQFR